MSDIPKLTEAGFDTEVLKSTLPVIVDFTATWCNPCKMLDPIVTQLSQDWDGKVKFYKLDVDENSNIAMQYGVMGVPTLIIFVNGNPMQRLSGYQPKDRIVSKFGSYALILPDPFRTNKADQIVCLIFFVSKLRSRAVNRRLCLPPCVRSPLYPCSPRASPGHRVQNAHKRLSSERWGVASSGLG